MLSIPGECYVRNGFPSFFSKAKKVIAEENITLLLNTAVFDIDYDHPMENVLMRQPDAVQLLRYRSSCLS